MKRSLLILMFFGIAGLSGAMGQTLDESWKFTRLYAADDTAGNTHLYYAQQKTRIYNCDNRVLEDRSTIHRYHNPSTNIDSVFIPTHDSVTMPGCYGGGGVSIANFHPFDGSPENAMFVGGFSDGFEPYAYMQIGSRSFYLSPLFQHFDEVIANSELGNSFFLHRNNKTVQLPITDDEDTLRVIENYWYDFEYVDTLSGYFTEYDFILYSLSRFDDSLAFYQKDGSVYRSENLGKSGELLDATINQNSQFHYDADSLHIYVTQKGSNSILVSNDYGKAGSWISKTLPSSVDFLSLDAETPGLVFFADSNRIYRSNDFASSFEVLHTFSKNIMGFHKKPTSDTFYVLFENELIEINGNETTILKEVPEKKKLSINQDEIPYKKGNEFTFRIYRREVMSEDSYRLVPTEDFKMKINESVTPSDSTIQQQIFFENNTNRPLFSELIFDNQTNIIAKPWDGEQNQVIMKNEREVYSPWVINTEQDSLFKLGIVRNIYLSYTLEISDTIATINFYNNRTDSSAKTGEEVSRIYWSNKFGIKDVYFWADSSGYRYFLKGAVLDGTVYGDTTRTFIVSNEPEPSNIPNQITLEQNYPNPFNPTTVISYQLDSNQLVQLEVFDVTGRKVATLVDGERQSAGKQQVTFEASGLSSGVYFYRLETGGQTLTRKMLLVK